jgi:peptidoglycan hydrolase-like protein with peptidoglycan-binding domain
MSFRGLRAAAAALALAVGLPVQAADLALVLVNSDYDSAGDLAGSGQAARFERELETAGFTVFAMQDGTGEELRAISRDFAAATDAEGQNRLVIVVSGHMAHTGSGNWLLGRDANRPDGFSVGAQGQSIDPLIALATQAQGQAVIMLAGTEGNTLRTGTALEPGLGAIEAPQGVTLVQGDLKPMLIALRDGILRNDASYAVARDRAPRGVSYSGFLSPAIGLLTTRDDENQPIRPELGDFAYWNAVQDIGTEDAYEAYISRYPNGTFTADARARIEGLRNAPLRAAQEGEAALGLTRTARREVQRYLSILGFDPRGIDGIFGPATRKALTDWQTARRFDPDGYLDADQIKVLRAEGAAKVAALEAEAKERQAKIEAEDRDYWAQTGRGGTAGGLRAYLRRYPDGLFAERARRDLTRIANQNAGNNGNSNGDGGQTDSPQARRMYNEARDADTVEAYSVFLREYPNSRYSADARRRMNELRQQNRDRSDQIAAQQEENVIAGNPVTRLLVERRLQQLGANPGPVDGQFDGATRRAIRQFQRNRGLTVTGYVTQATMVRLLAGG